MLASKTAWKRMIFLADEMDIGRPVSNFLGNSGRRQR